MKRIFLTAGIVATLLLGAGCGQNQAPVSQSPTSSATASPRDNFDYNEYIKTPDVLSWKAGQEIQDKITIELRAGKTILEITEPRKLNTPPDIYPPQLVKYFQLSDMQFVLVNVLSGMTLGRWDEKTTTSSGIWYADKNDTEWKPLISLAHASGHEPQNNIFDFWNEGKELRLLLVDNNGAGSGEGKAKVLGSIEGGKQWKTMWCFDTELEGFRSLQNKMKTTYHGTINEWIKKWQSKGTFKEYTYNSSLDRFEFGNLPAGGESCKNVMFSE